MRGAKSSLSPDEFDLWYEGAMKAENQPQAPEDVSPKSDSIRSAAPAEEGTAEGDRVRLEPEWKAALEDEFSKPYMKELRAFLADRYRAGATVYPPAPEIFNALNHTPLSKVRVVILGQDPYHGPGQAHGLCFSVRKGVRVPPSLVNIFQEIQSDLEVPVPKHGELTAWAEQGVLLLNTCLTVERGKAGSHHGKGWETFTDRIIGILNEREAPMIFVLWGSPAQRKQALITNPRHFILKSPHPSPLSAYRGFIGSRHFSKINEKLSEWDQTAIDWRLPE